MNRMRLGWCSFIVASGYYLLLLEGSPVLANAKSPALVRKDLFVLIPDKPPSDLQAAQNLPPKDEIPLPGGDGKDTTRKVCGKCHSTDVWVKQRHTAEKWSQIIDNMTTKGMEASDDDLATVNDYLGKYLAPPPKDAPSPAPQN